MPTGSSTNNTMGSTNPVLSGMFTQMFGGPNGAGATGVGALSKIASGGDITALNQALTQSSQQQTTQGTAAIKEAFGSSGMGSSSALAKSVGTFQSQQGTALQQSIATTDLQAQQQQLQAGNYLSQLFSASSNQYFNNSSNSSSFNPLALIATLFA